MYTYIVVDDEPLTRRGTIKKIGTLNDSVQCIGEASNGAEGLMVIEKLNPDIIITDMNMPVLDGTAFLQRLCAEYPDKPIIVISGYKDFEYAKQAISARAINYILKPFSRDAIQEALQGAVDLIENKATLENKIVSIEAEKEYVKYDYDVQIIKNLILGYHTSAPEFVSEKLKVIDHNHHFILMTIHCIKTLKESALMELIEQSGFGDLSLYLPHLHNDKMAFFILFFPEKTPLKLNAICKQLAVDFIDALKYENDDVSIGISASKSDLLQLNTAFKETIAALNSKMLKDTNGYYLFTETSTHMPALQWESTNEFLFRIEAGETEQVVLLINKFFDDVMAKEHCSLNELKLYCASLMQKTRTILSRYFENTAAGDSSSSVQNILDAMFAFEEIKEYFLRFFTNVSAGMASKSVYASDDPIENIKTYIQRNYFNDLTLEFISSLFYMNRSYCSHLFKKRTDSNFVDYVNAVRIEEAKRLLAHSDKKMYQIAKAVGYDNVKYFFRIFKKIAGVTPEQYRKE